MGYAWSLFVFFLRLPLQGQLHHISSVLDTIRDERFNKVCFIQFRRIGIVLRLPVRLVQILHPLVRKMQRLASAVWLIAPATRRSLTTLRSRSTRSIEMPL